MYISSTIGRMPTMAAPVAMPIKPCSLIGVSITRSSPNSSKRLRYAEETAIPAHIFADQKDALVAAHLFLQRLIDRLDKRCRTHRHSPDWFE